MALYQMKWLRVGLRSEISDGQCTLKIPLSAMGSARTLRGPKLHFPPMSVVRCPSSMGVLPSCYGGKNDMLVVCQGSIGTELEVSLGRSGIMETHEPFSSAKESVGLGTRPHDSHAHLCHLLAGSVSNLWNHSFLLLK